ncbi:MAG TPA: ADOP family duplicated permease [Gemmatimonadaceae bacterium]|nr:ADOP family duplicated permease [Gemmatimonadaceae bacterium]
MRRHSPLLPSAVRRIFQLPQSRARVARELTDEMRIHIDMRAEELCALGMSEPDARAEALRRFGDEDEFEAYTARRATLRARAYGIRELLTEWRQDLRFALRLFRKHAPLTLLVVSTLALGIGANTAIFSVVHRLLIAPLPYRDGDRIVMLAMEGKTHGFAPPGDDAVRAWRGRARSLEMIGAVSIDYIMVQDPGERDSIVASVTSNYLRLLGIAPVIGRDFTPEDERPASPRVAMISYGLWQRVYGGRLDVLGKVIAASDRTDNPPLGAPRNAVGHTIIGVAPPNMGLPISYEPPGSKWRQATPSIWVPASLDSLGDADTYARLRSGTSADRASRELQNILDSVPTRADAPRTEAGVRRCCARAVRAQDMLDPREARMIEILFVAVAVLLLIACANVANLLMARAWTRRREFAVRIALGAGRGRLTRLVLTESVLLALAGGLLGVALAWVTLHAVVAMRPPALENLDDVRVEPMVLLWCVAVSVFTGLLFGSAPALLSIAGSAGDVLRSESRASAGNRYAPRIRSALIVGEIAMSLLLLVAAGLLVRSFVALQHTPLGFDPHGLASVQVIFHRGPREQVPGKQKAVLEQLRAIPGVTDAAIGGMPGEAFGVAGERLEGDADATGQSRSVAVSGVTFMSPTYFRVTRMSLLQGRVPDAESEVSPVIGRGPIPSPAEIVVNRSLAEQLWPRESAIGKRVHSTPARGAGTSSTVVGVVEDTRMPGPRPAMDAEIYQPPVPIQTAFVVRTAIAPADLKAALSRAVLSADRSNVVYRLTIGETYLRDAMAPARFAMSLLATFSGAALLLSAVGLYGVIAYAVTQRTREIGIRLALGASPRSVTSLVVRSGLALAAVGVVLGVAAAVGGTRVLSGVLNGVSPGDPVTFAAIVVLVVAIALAACYLPARRAAHVDPTEALRAE